MSVDGRWGMRSLGWAALVAAIAGYAYDQGPVELAGRGGDRDRVVRLWSGVFELNVVYRTMHGNDFKHLYLGAIFLGHGENPYDEESFVTLASRYGFRTINPYVYPPTTGLVLRPLTYLGPSAAAWTWFWLNHAMLIGSLLLCAHLFLGFRDPWRLAIVALLAATSFPLRRTLTAGQLNCVLLLLYGGLCWAVLRRYAWFAGLMVGFGILFKLVPGIFVVYFLWKKRWRELAWSGVWFAAILAVSIAMAGWKVHLAYWPVMRAMGYGKSVWQARLVKDGVEPFYRDAFNQSLNSLFHHILARDPVERQEPTEQVNPWVSLGDRGARLADGLTVLASLGLVLVALWAIGRGGGVSDVESRPPGSPPRESLEVSLMILLSLLLPSIMWDHYGVALFLPQIVLLAHFLERREWLTWRMAVLLAASALLARPIAFDQPDFHQGAGILCMSAKLYGVLLVFALIVYELVATDWTSPADRPADAKPA